MKVACASDTHGRWAALNYPDADVLVFAGDILNNYGAARGHPGEIAKQLNELDYLNDFCGDLKKNKYKEIILVAGNHDWVFQKRLELARKRLYNAVYLQDEYVNIGDERGELVKFYGSPWQPWFWDWAFNFPPREENFFRWHATASKVWEKIPYDTNVLITHGPPHEILDDTPSGEKVGCPILAGTIKSFQNLKAHIFGHIHHSHGSLVERDVQFINASICTEEYRPDNPIQVVEI